MAEEMVRDYWIVEQEDAPGGGTWSQKSGAFNNEKSTEERIDLLHQLRLERGDPDPLLRKVHVFEARKEYDPR